MELLDFYLLINIVVDVGFSYSPLFLLFQYDDCGFPFYS